MQIQNKIEKITSAGGEEHSKNTSKKYPKYKINKTLFLLPNKMFGIGLGLFCYLFKWKINNNLQNTFGGALENYGVENSFKFNRNWQKIVKFHEKLKMNVSWAHLRLFICLSKST